MKYCKDCIHFNDVNKNYCLPPKPGGPECKHPASLLYTDPVWGNKHYDTCKAQRNYPQYMDACGLDGKYFQGTYK